MRYVFKMTTSSGSSSKPKKLLYIYDLPYPQRKQLCQILDADGKWEELGGRFMKLSRPELSAFGRAVYCKGSPTSELLDRFGRENGTIDILFVNLHRMNHLWAMTTIQDYVSPKYLHLLNRSPTELRTSEFISTKSKGDNLQPSAPSQSQMVWKSSSSERLGATGYAMSKLQIDSDNINNTNTQSSVKKMNLDPNISRINSLSQQQQQQRAVTRSDHVTNGLVSKSQNVSNMSRHGTNADRKDNNTSVNGNQASKSPSLKLNIPVPDKPRNEIIEQRTQPSSKELPPLPKVPYAEISQHFHKDNILGQGGFGIVYKAYWKASCVAVKRLQPKSKTNQECASLISLKQSQTEMNILYSRRFDNILPIYGISTDGPEPCLIYQFMVNGSLEDRLLLKGGSKPLNWDQRSKIALGTAKGLNYLHTVDDKPLIHGDIKSANILLDKDMDPKIGDFGLARPGPPGDMTHVKVSSVQGTQVYLPDEYLRSGLLSEKVDVFSYGIVLLEIATGLRAVTNKVENVKPDKLQKHIVQIVQEFEHQCDRIRDKRAGEERSQWFEKLLRLGKKCSSVKKSSRPIMKEVVEKLIEYQTEVEHNQDLIERGKSLGVPMELRYPPSSIELRSPPSPMELQMWYDMHRLNLHHLNMAHMPTGIQGPPPFLPLDISLPSTVPSVHTSQIRAPPDMKLDYRTLKYAPPGPTPASSVAATDGSSRSPQGLTNDRGPCSQGYTPVLSTTSKHSPSSVPLLTLLGMKMNQSEQAMSGIPSRDHVVVTEKVEESELQLGLSGDLDLEITDDDDEEEDDDDGDNSSLDNERVFQMTDIKATS